MSSCYDEDVVRGRTCYKKYLEKTLKDPESLVIYEEKIEKLDPPRVKFTVDFGGKNSYGAMVRKTSIFETWGSLDALDVDGSYTSLD